ncbi:Gamma-2-syntrophin [Orchesella cincta]|uniref:Gamma-2-syntrophin n=1 Tax=Orchesella cincta TaxID=48709 RepID=A0A1D2MM44_ORCCI|nr:Gamma-2-syntrophin [Orchesella cincta]
MFGIKCSYSVWWGGKPCQLELDFPGAAFNLYRSSSKPSSPLWTRQFSSLKGSSDDARTRLTLKFHGNVAQETMECRDLHRVLFTIHSFLLAKVVQ